jgi:hypothetical protein
MGCNPLWFDTFILKMEARGDCLKNVKSHNPYISIHKILRYEINTAVDKTSFDKLLNRDIRTASEHIDSVVQSRYLAGTVTYPNYIHEEIKSRCISGSAWYNSIQILPVCYLKA